MNSKLLIVLEGFAEGVGWYTLTGIIVGMFFGKIEITMDAIQAFGLMLIVFICIADRIRQKEEDKV